MSSHRQKWNPGSGPRSISQLPKPVPSHSDGHKPFPLPDMASSDIPMQIAETIQTAHLNREPSAAHDINPSTAADTREPVRLEEKKARDVDEDDEDDEIPVSVLRPRRRFSHLPPIPSVSPVRPKAPKTTC